MMVIKDYSLSVLDPQKVPKRILGGQGLWICDNAKLTSFINQRHSSATSTPEQFAISIPF